MASIATDVSPSEPQSNVIQQLADSVANLAVQVDASQRTVVEKHKPESLQRALAIYSPTQILYLHNSPLVQPPNGMPDLKDWFGTENEQNLSKKESETTTTTNNTRDRRFRRDLEDGERPSFRSALSQPSQMGNFKHQSLRAPDRDRDRDNRDKEGHEHLRNLSDKYDRDRLGSTARAKERDAAPHLSVGTSRIAGQSQSSSTTPRRTDTRDAGKRSDDWRRVSDRGPRDDRPDNTRRDREGRPRSRVRDSSRPRRDPSTARRDKDRARDEHHLDRYRDDYRYESYERDADRGSEHEDPRRWRDDGKRDERMAARRLNERSDREPRGIREYDSYRPGSDDRKRPSPRDRKVNGTDEKDRDDRRDRDREREKEKEPAWMDTYIPSPTNGGILGGKEGELDGIQAWKKDMKDKQDKLEKLETDKSAPSGAREDSSGTLAPPGLGLVSGNNGLDEIQMFRMLMKQEEEKKKQAEATGNKVTNDAPPIVSSLTTSVDVEMRVSTTPSPGTSTKASTTDSPNALLTMLTNANPVLNPTSPPDLPRPTQVGHTDVSSSASGLFPNPQASSAKLIEPSPTPSTLNPPPGSRLLAFGARPPSATIPKSQSPITPSPLSVLESSILSNHSLGLQLSATGTVPKSDHRAPTFTPFEEGGVHATLQETGDLPQVHSSIRRVSGERTPLQPTENGPHIDTTFAGDPSANVALASSKGSRFAKFFDGNKNRDPAIARALTSGGNPGSLQAVPRPDDNSGPANINPDNRAMAEIFNMLHNSVQGRPLNGMDQSISSLSSGGTPFNQQQRVQSNLQMVQHQLQHQQIPHLQSSSRLDSLYDSRLDDRSFVPDGMVPGLRNAPPRGQDHGMFSDSIDDLHFARQRMASQRPDHIFPNQVPLFSQQPGRNAGPPLQQAQFRGGPSPIPLPNQLQNPVQRLPPGLANLGGRPPHEPSQFLGMANMQNAGLLNALHGSALQQPPFNGVPGASNIGFGGPPMRGPPAPSPIQNNMSHNSINIGHPNNMDMRLPNQPHLMGLGGVGGVRNGIGFNQGPGQMQPLMGMRQQQPPIPLPHHMTQGLPAHLQQQSLPPANAQNHDLMALLMGGPLRE